MIENLFTSKTRIKLLRLFLSNPDKRFYLRGLEKELQESLTPLRRELLRFTNMGILSIQEEANIKYYFLNKDFERLEELKNLVLGRQRIAESRLPEAKSLKPVYVIPRFGLLSVITVLLIGLVAFLIWTNSKNIQNIAKAISSKGPSYIKSEATSSGAKAGELKSSHWKILPGNWPVLGGTEEEKNESKEL